MGCSVRPRRSPVHDPGRRRAGRPRPVWMPSRWCGSHRWATTASRCSSRCPNGSAESRSRPTRSRSTEGGDRPGLSPSRQSVRTRTTVGIVFDNRPTVAQRDLLAAQGAAVELVRGVEAWDGVHDRRHGRTNRRPSTHHRPIRGQPGPSAPCKSERKVRWPAVSMPPPGRWGATTWNPPSRCSPQDEGLRDAAALAPSVGSEGVLLTIHDATSARAADLIPAMDDLTGALTGRHLLTLPVWGPGSAVLDLTAGGRSFQATVELPRPARGTARVSVAARDEWVGAGRRRPPDHVRRAGVAYIGRGAGLDERWSSAPDRGRCPPQRRWPWPRS